MKSSRTVGAAFGAVLVTGGLLAAAPAASAADGSIGQRETVCADSLYLRTDPGTGAFDGQLFRGETFLVESRHGGSLYGFAYGNINRKGYVTDGYFC